MVEERTFTIAGKDHRIDRPGFEARLALATPERVTRMNKYFVTVGGRRFPIKQAVAVGLGIPRAVFQSQQAFSVLEKLGYEVETLA
jgi:5-methylcytosine-specific restriction protein B